MEAPVNFQKEHSMISPTSYKNPFVDLTHRSRNEHYQKFAQGPALWTQKTDILQV